jgi:hypothetical protein
MQVDYSAVIQTELRNSLVFPDTHFHHWDPFYWVDTGGPSEGSELSPQLGSSPLLPLQHCQQMALLEF